MKKTLIFLVLVGISISTIALEEPKSSSFDKRIQHVNYNEDNIVEVNAYPGISTHIAFAPGEEILDIASGFSDGWQFGPRRNNLYLKPKSIKGKGNAVLEPIAGKWDTDLHVTTNLRIYTFQLVLHSEEMDSKLKNNPKMAYLIKFRYPAEEAAKARQAAEQKQSEKRLAKKPDAHNWNFTMQVGSGAESIAPSAAYDDGRFTYLQFPGNREFPAAFVVAADQSESLVNSHIDPKSPDTLVIHRVAPEMVLRLGKEVVGIFNDSYDANGLPVKNGTTVPGIKRVINVTEEGRAL